MNIPEAIGILAAKKLDDVERHAENSAEACQLGIEALDRLQNNRNTKPIINLSLLPSETPEPPPSDSLAIRQETR